MREFVRLEPSAREIAKGILQRSGHRLPPEILVEVEELMVDAAHDGLEFGEDYANTMKTSIPGGLEHYTLGYVHGIQDVSSNPTERQGE